MPGDDDALAAARRRYLVDQVVTASPTQRLLMLFDVALRDLHGATEALAGRDLKEVNDRLVHAQQVVLALRDPLDVTTPVGRSLWAVYSFCLRQLVEANLTKDPALIEPCTDMIERIARTNRQVAAELAGEPRAAAATARAATATA
ncbi:MAG TPA: flagellar export chaperone FliS [Acidimicrobiales bacterium]|jgi:flagellar protein FliS